jgi:hypothetical protein
LTNAPQPIATVTLCSFTAPLVTDTSANLVEEALYEVAALRRAQRAPDPRDRRTIDPDLLDRERAAAFAHIGNRLERCQVKVVAGRVGAKVGAGERGRRPRSGRR